MKELTINLTGNFVGTAGVTSDRILFKCNDATSGPQLVGIHTKKAFLRDIDLRQQYDAKAEMKAIALGLTENGPKVTSILDILEIEAR